jgi:two-component system cell cycle sensor histidine kinase/response regulator CckA
MTATKILVVEDERIVALHLKQKLTVLGYDVVAVASGEAALQKIGESRPDVVLMDIHIEGLMDGVETASRIPPDLEIPVIYVTAFSEEATLERARATKPYGYLIKPYSERELHATIQVALERRRADSALRASEDRFRSILDAISEGVFLAEAGSGALVEANRPGVAMFGYAADELIGRDIRDLLSNVAPYTQHEAGEWIGKAAASGRPEQFEWHCRTKDGRLFWAEISIRFASISRQNVLLAIVRDVSERRGIEAQLRQSQKMEAIGQLTGGVAHDFNNLIGVIIGNIDLLRGVRPDDAETEELCREALDAALSGAELTRRLLAFSRRQPLRAQRIDLTLLVSGTVKLLRRLVHENIAISFEFKGEPCFVMADPTQLEAALTNLATNARDAMPRGGKIFISTGHRHLDANHAASIGDIAPGEYAIIEVTDNGAGIPPEALGHIFEPFFTTKSRDRGTGLGLSMVFGFLKQTGGHVSVYSEVGFGTTFRLYLPCTSVPEESPAVAPIHIPSAGKGGTVLVVEDNAPLRRVAARQLREFAYVVLEAANGTEALAQLKATKVDVLFTDVVMPGGIDGFELARAALDGWPAVNVILTSGFPETSLQDKFATSNFPLLTKPYRKADLLRMVQDALETTQARKTAMQDNEHRAVGENRL